MMSELPLDDVDDVVLCVVKLVGRMVKELRDI